MYTAKIKFKTRHKGEIKTFEAGDEVNLCESDMKGLLEAGLIEDGKAKKVEPKKTEKPEEKNFDKKLEDKTMPSTKLIRKKR